MKAHGLVLDLGSDSVALGAFDTQGEKLSLIFYKRISTTREHKPQPHELWDVTEHALQDVGKSYIQFLREHGGKARSFHIVASAPWTTDQIHEDHLHAERQVTWEEKAIHKMIAQKYNLPEHGTDWFITGIKARGYTIHSLPCVSNEIDVNWIGTDLDKTLKERTEAIVSAFVHVKPVWHSLTSVALRAGLQTIPHPHWMMVDIHGEHTEMIAVKDQHIEWLVSIPVGSNAMLRAIRNQTGFPSNVVQSLLMLREKDVLDVAAKQSIEPLLGEAYGSWMTAMQTALGDKSFNGITYLALNTPYDSLYTKPLKEFFMVKNHTEPIIIHDQAVQGLVNLGSISMTDTSIARYGLGLRDIL